jgi:hypothetical protein|tara:strand:- start:395 stop:574 length:180 start_codon:yes stop_codon:yes gene_type:complete
MPIKYKKSQKTRDKQTGKEVVEHFYIKQLSKDALENMYKESKPKVRLKILNELEKRKVN